MKQTLVQLHPDFNAPLKAMLQVWNATQETMEFIGLRPGRTVERSLLSAGTISDDEASTISDQLRQSAGYSRAAGIVVFTEKRLYDDDHYQLFVGGREEDEEPPRVAILSLHFLREAYAESNTRAPIIFRAILSNILFSIGIDLGLEDHRIAKGCIMDFCGYLPDIEKGLLQGPKFCDAHQESLRSLKGNFLLDLAHASQQFADLEDVDADVTESVLLRGKRYTEQSARFDYDIALSFAGADRVPAEQLATELRCRGLAVFYDEFGRADLWGKNLQIYLPELYRLRARYCVVFLSSHYSESRWTRLELEAALAREFEDGREYVLPIRLDSAPVQGILPTRAYVEWREETPQSLADLVTQKLAKAAEQAAGADR
jgi:predicted Zn-dependent protease